jgi:hypothetical protein
MESPNTKINSRKTFFGIFFEIKIHENAEFTIMMVSQNVDPNLWISRLILTHSDSRFTCFKGEL